MRAPHPLRKFILELSFFALYVGLFLGGFWVDVPRAEQVTGQLLSLLVIGVSGYRAFTPRGQRKTLEEDKPLDLSRPIDQWLFFLQMAFTVAFVVVQVSLDWPFWSKFTIALPLFLIALTCVIIAIRPWVRRRRAEQTQD